MNLETIMTKQEQEAVMNLIYAHLSLEAAKMRLWQAEQSERAACEEVTRLYFETEPDKDAEPVKIATIPDHFVTYYGGKMYAIEIDTEGSHAHLVRLIAGVLGSHPNQSQPFRAYIGKNDIF